LVEVLVEVTLVVIRKICCPKNNMVPFPLMPDVVNIGWGSWVWRVCFTSAVEVPDMKASHDNLMTNQQINTTVYIRVV